MCEKLNSVTIVSKQFSPEVPSPNVPIKISKSEQKKPKTFNSSITLKDSNMQV